MHPMATASVRPVLILLPWRRSRMNPYGSQNGIVKSRPRDRFMCSQEGIQIHNAPSMQTKDTRLAIFTTLSQRQAAAGLEKSL